MTARPCRAIMAASDASFWSLLQGGPTDFPSDAIVFRKLSTEVARARSACSSYEAGMERLDLSC